MKKVYCQITSLSKLKKSIEKKKNIICIERNLFNPDGYITYHSIYDLQNNDIIALEKSENNGIVTPYEWIIWNDLAIL